MRKTIGLNFDWLYKPDFQESYLSNLSTFEDFEKVMIPHTNKILPYNNFNETDYQFISSYLKTFTVDETFKNHRLFIHFGAVMTCAEVYLNGKLVGSHEGGFTPFDVDITKDVIFEAENRLFVKVDSREIKDVPPFGNVVDYLCYGGIYREVSIVVKPMLGIEHLLIKTLEAPSLKEQEMTLDLSIIINSDIEETYHVEINVLDQGQNILSHASEATFKTIHHFRGTVFDIIRWNLDNPKLYDVEVILKKGDIEIDRLSQRIGFRSAEFTTDGFVLNNQKVKLIGLNRHQSYPYVGFAMPKRMQESDADILKFELGCNIVRTSHYMQSDHFVNRCDEVGLLVLEEIPGWQYIGNDQFKDLTYQALETMISHHFNHPSIVLCGIRINESPDDHEFYEKTNEIAKSIDNGRQVGGIRNFKKSEFLEDVYTYNDFSHIGTNTGIEKPRKIAGKLVPYLVTEHNGHIFPTKKYDHEEKRRSQALRHLQVLESSFASETCSGAIGWCMNDYNTHVEFGSGDKICYHGVLDMFRIPKYAASVYASQQTKKPVLTVCSNMVMGDYAKSMIPPTVIFTNCDYVKVYRNNRLVDTFYSAWDDYKAIPFAPVIVDDYVGNLIFEDKLYKPSVAKRLKKILISVYKDDASTKFANAMRMINLRVLHKIKFNEAYDLYGRYVGDWGKEGSHYKYEGYIDDVCVITKEKGAHQQMLLKATLDASVLKHHETYDVTRIVVKKTDEWDNDLTYANDVISVDTSDHLEVIGPKSIALIGGSIGIYVKTTGLLGKGLIHIKSENHPEITLSIEIE